MKNKGITLVALVITIIILLILAGIAISQLTNNGLFENTKIAKQEYENSSEKEDDMLKQYENAINNGEIVSDRDMVTISKEEYERLKNVNNYSTEEKVVGKWTDGKPLYQKVITIKFNSVGSDNYARVSPEVLIDENFKIGFIENVFSIDKEYNMFNNGLESVDVSTARNFYIHGKYLGAWAGNGSSCANTTFYAIIKYTKTTD